MNELLTKGGADPISTQGFSWLFRRGVSQRMVFKHVLAEMRAFKRTEGTYFVFCYKEIWRAMQ